MPTLVQNMRTTSPPCSLYFLPLLLLPFTHSFPLSCHPSSFLGCFNATPAPVSFLVDSSSSTLTLDACALHCAADGFPVAAATSTRASVAFCSCGSALSPASSRLPDAQCALPCPGNRSQSCGGLGAVSVWRSACDGPLPPQPLGALGPPLPSPACSSPASRGWPFCNTSLSVEARIDDLMARIAVSEYGGQLTARASAPIHRLGMGQFMWGTNAVHGVCNYAECRATTGRCPTTWPNGVSLGATWDRAVWRAMGAVTGTELRAYDNLEWRKNAATGSGPVGGLIAWGPTINIMRDSRWGRTQEAYSEDPFLTSRAAVEITRGMQEGVEDPHHMLAVATLKHAFAYSLEQWVDRFGHEYMRQTFDARVSAFDLGDTYTPAFAAAIQEGRAGGIMYSANALNGIPLCVDAGSDALLKSWVQPGQPFYRATDGGQIENAVAGHHYAPNLDAAIGLAAAAESDIADGEEYLTALTTALCNGNVSLAAAQRLVRNTLHIRFALGLFDPAEGQPYLGYGEAHIATAAANASVVKASREGLVLLKNTAATLPFSPLPQARGGEHDAAPLASLAVVGPCADDMVLLGGNYLGPVCPNGPHGPSTDCHPSILGALRLRAPDVLYAPGGGINSTSPPELAAAAAAATGAARTILCLGIDHTLEREQLDRISIGLPDSQLQLFRAVEAAIAGTGKALAVVLVHGGPLSIPEVTGSQAVGAILDALLPGCATGGEAVAGALFGDFSPSGKLPYTIPHTNWSDLSNFTDMGVAPTPQSPLGRTYRYATQPPLFPFGFGLSYSDFALSWVGGAEGGGSVEPLPTAELSPASPPLLLGVAVRNSGAVAAAEVVQLYFSPLPDTFVEAPPHFPISQLWEFDRTAELAPGQEEVLRFNLTAQSLALTSAEGNKVVMAGSFNVTVTRGHGQALWVIVNITLGAEEQHQALAPLPPLLNYPLQHPAFVKTAATLPPLLSLVASYVGAPLSALQDAPGVPSPRSSNSWCPTAAAFEWLPARLGDAPSPPLPSLDCFQTVSANFTSNATHATATLRGDGVGAGWPLCAAALTLATSFSLSPLLLLTPSAPLTTATWAFPFGAAEAADAASKGAELSAWPCGVAGTLESLAATLPLLDANETIAAAANAAWLTARGIFPPPSPFVPPNASTALALGERVEKFAYIAISEWDFLGSLEAWGTGRTGTSHSALLVRRGGALFVCESTFGWAGGDGVQVHSWEEWLALSDPVQSSALLLPTPQLLAAWNETAFWSYFDGLQGNPYGTHNFLTTVFDQGEPLGSFPAPLSSRTLSAFLVSADAALGGADTGAFQPSYNASVFDLIGEALLRRLPTAAGCTTLACLTKEALREGVGGLLGALALPEDPAWRYGGQALRVCSAFCAGGLAAGLGIGAPKIWETEQTPRDNVVAGMWDASGWDAESCPWGLGVSGNTSVTFCQFAGKLYKLPLEGAGAYPLYARMNEKCGSRWPQYARCGNSTSGSCEC